MELNLKIFHDGHFLGNDDKLGEGFVLYPVRRGPNRGWVIEVVVAQESHGVHRIQE